MSRGLPVSATAGIAAAAAVAFYYLRNPGRSAETAVADLVGLLTGTIRLTDAQLRQVAIIQQGFSAAGLGWLAVGAVANAYAESRLDPKAEGDGGLSIGLFQLHAKGAGSGLSTAEREDPVVNTRRIVETVQGPQGAPVRGARGRATNAELASLFAQHVERCHECGHGGGSAQLTYRAELVSRLFGLEVAAEVP